ncbi:unnamed protein product [Paramecium sonneborni]|uniref:WD40-repeat-containing domain n=1 Tax=Paramecium sonneborni TaxID=65129 RepID=A0A8S1RDS2_9CILI|nr:unnamed protein product [Paramecium sonneborni]
MEFENNILCQHKLQVLQIVNDSQLNINERLLCQKCLNQYEGKAEKIDIQSALDFINKNQNDVSKYTNQLLFQNILHLNTFILNFKLLQTEIQQICQEINLKANLWLEDLQFQNNKVFIEIFDQSFNNECSLLYEDFNDVNQKLLIITTKYLPHLNTLINPFINFKQFNTCQQVIFQLQKVYIEDAIQQINVESQRKKFIQKIQNAKQSSIQDLECTNILEIIAQKSEENKNIQSELLEQLQNLIRLKKSLQIIIQDFEMEVINHVFLKYGEYFQFSKTLNSLINNGSFDELKQISNKIEQNQIIMREIFKLKLKTSIENILTQNLSDIKKQNYQNGRLQISTHNQIMSQSFKQFETCYAIAFNQNNSIMISTCGKQIKVWNFHQGQIILRFTLQKHIDDVTCLLFSQNLNQFISGCGNEDGSIICWKQKKDSTWKSSQPFKYHQLGLRQMIMNRQENQLISGSLDKTIIIWKLDFSQNCLIYQYTLSKHQNKLLSLSMNESETCLVSCSEDQSIIIWSKESGVWKFKEIVNQQVRQIGRQVKFLNDSQFIWIQMNLGIIHFFEVQNLSFKEILEKQLFLNNQKQDWNLFPIIHNKHKNIIVIRHYQSVFILRQQQDGSLKLMADPIQCKSEYNYGSISNDGQFLVLWDLNTKQYNVYEILD